MTRQTSIDCFNQIKAQGLLSRMRFKVYEALFNIGKPSTTREIYATLNLAKQEATRLTELRNLGVIYEKSVRKCNVTGRTAIEWDLTDNLPQGKIIKKTDKPSNLKKCIDYIISKMDSDCMMFIDQAYLKKLNQ